MPDACYWLKCREQEAGAASTVRSRRRVARWAPWEPLGRYATKAEAFEALARARKASSLRSYGVFFKGKQQGVDLPSDRLDDNWVEVLALLYGFTEHVANGGSSPLWALNAAERVVAALAKAPVTEADRRAAWVFLRAQAARGGYRA